MKHLSKIDDYLKPSNPTIRSGFKKTEAHTFNIGYGGFIYGLGFVQVYVSKTKDACMYIQTRHILGFDFDMSKKLTEYTIAKENIEDELRGMPRIRNGYHGQIQIFQMAPTCFIIDIKEGASDRYVIIKYPVFFRITLIT